MARTGYPLPKFHFEVDWGNETRMGFTEVSGLDFESEVIEYREGTDILLTKMKQPGLRKFSNITLKRGTFQGDIKFFNEWKKTVFFQEKNDGNKYRSTVTIKLLNEEHQPILVWTVRNAWPSKIQSSDMKADANEIAIETIELVHEGLALATQGA
ncbi:phage tail protein [Spirosoma panaciterrae]|uniref:phage tail protein n=1 Tax=Spirosoma panaciterrae TaxID=496058 RepID=UPI0003717287|nr:phage tail protein [Spirosoma panaciterrae]